MRTRVTVSGTVRAEVVTLDRAGETLTLCDTGYIHHLTDLEQIDTNSATQPAIGSIFGSQQ